MIREYTVFVAEKLFYVMGGFPLIDSIWLFAYVGLLAVIMMLPFIIFSGSKKHWNGILGLVLFLPILTFAMGPPIAQMQMMQQCENVEIMVSTDKVDNQTLKMQQCRFKENYYGEFDDWKIYNIN